VESDAICLTGPSLVLGCCNLIGSLGGTIKLLIPGFMSYAVDIGFVFLPSDAYIPY